MIDIACLCPQCMKDKNGAEVCPHCGTAPLQPSPHHLKPGTILNGKYLLGNVLGEGGFGITYVGFDLNLEIRVAIKEYFPNGLVARNTTNTDAITVYSGPQVEIFDQGKNKFINEAKALAKFDNSQGIVSVKDFFLENGTAYITMEFLEGQTLKEYLDAKGGSLPADQVIKMLLPLMKSLDEVHNAGVIHRDISPDNIMITGNNQVKLLDFGAARNMSPEGSKSLSIQLKPGYAPEEQYRTHGKQGPWTDVYALCATIYRAITGKPPIESLERSHQDTLPFPSQLGINIHPDKEQALMIGLAVQAENRFQNMNDLYNALTLNYTEPISIPRPTEDTTTPPWVYNPQPQKKSKVSPAVIFAAILGALSITFAVSVLFIVLSGSAAENNDPLPSSTAIATAAPKPVFSKVEASSTRNTDYTSGAAVNYFASYAVDGNPATAWSANRNVSLTPTLTLKADTKQHVSGIKLANGYFKSQQTYTRNRRITKVRVEYEGGSKEQSLSLDSFGVMQDIKFDSPADTAYINIQVLETYDGDWHDICISEVTVY